MNDHSAASRDITRYLERIGFVGPVDGTAGTLAGLQERHLQAVPYENFDILAKVPLSLDAPDLYAKIVERRRGGYCFELNGLFAWLLSGLGFATTSFMARFWRDEPDPPPKRRHHVLKVIAEGTPYLCDVGVGGVIPRRPLVLADGVVQRQGKESYRLDRDPDWGWMLREWTHGEWRPLYSFTEEPQLPRDFLMATYWCENAPDSIFSKHAMVSIHTPDGRITLAGDEFRVFAADGVTSTRPESDAERDRLLRMYFGLSLAGREVAILNAAWDASQAAAVDERFDVFDEEMNWLGAATREEVHRTGAWHQTFHCWVLQRTGAGTFLVVQRRHATKDTNPGKLDVSCAGHLQQGERPADGVRELREELGIEVEFGALLPVGVFKSTAVGGTVRDNEFLNVFLLVRDEDGLDGFSPALCEVSGLYRIGAEDFARLCRREVDKARIAGFEVDDQGMRRERTDVMRRSDMVEFSAEYYEALLACVGALR